MARGGEFGVGVTLKVFGGWVRMARGGEFGVGVTLKVFGGWVRRARGGKFGVGVTLKVFGGWVGMARGGEFGVGVTLKVFGGWVRRARSGVKRRDEVRTPHPLKESKVVQQTRTPRHTVGCVAGLLYSRRHDSEGGLPDVAG